MIFFVSVNLDVKILEIFHRGVLCLIAKEHIHENSLDIYIAMKIKF